LRLLVIALAVIYGVGYLYAASLVVRILLVMWTVRKARPYAVVFALLAPMAIAFYPIWLLPAWRPSQARVWLDSHPDLAKKYDDGVDQLYGELGYPRTLLQKWRFWVRRWKFWRDIRRRPPSF
jgi:hypothetical protein